jgi:uncharacterized Zn finger protein
VDEADLLTACSCPDWANPCKHVAATHYVLGEAFDRDPFLLFELRGRSKAQVLEALRAARAGEASGPPSRRRAGRISAPSGEPGEVATVALGKLGTADYDLPREPLPALRLTFATPPISGGVLRQLGIPAGWGSSASPVEMLGPLIRAAAERALSLAMADPELAEPGIAESGALGAMAEATAPTERTTARVSTEAKPAPRRSKRARAARNSASSGEGE